MEVLDWGWGLWSLFGCVTLMTISLCFNFHKNPSCLKVSRTLLKNDDTLLEFRRMWRFLTGAGIFDYVLDVPGMSYLLVMVSLVFLMHYFHLMSLLLIYDHFSAILAHCPVEGFSNFKLSEF